MPRATRAFALLLAVAALAACSVKETGTPALSGPSELGLSLTVQASPDVITQDGVSQSAITVLARDGSGAAVRNQTLYAEITIGGVSADFGRLSAHTLTTGSDGKATAYYTAPPAPTAVTGGTTTVGIVVTPVGTNYDAAWARTISIRLVPLGEVIPGADVAPGFSFSPEEPGEGVGVAFDGSVCSGDDETDCTTGTATSWSWNFGDGGTASGAVVAHAFSRAGAYSVTLTVTDGQGRAASVTRIVTVTASDAPTASFVVSPTAPRVAEQVYFNGSGSTAATGRTLRSYRWDYGDGETGSGVRSDHDYAAAGTYTVTLVVTDDLGRTGSTTKTVTVAAAP